jgi:hypothetical protein
VNTNAPEDRVEQILAESGTYYLIGYASPAPPHDGRRHRVSVRSRAPDVEIRARDGYVSTRAASSPAAASAGDRLIAAPIQSRGLTMRVAAVPAPLAASPKAVVVLGIEVHAESAVKAKRIDFTVAAVNPSTGKVIVRQQFSNTFGATGSTAKGWARFHSHLPLRPGRYLVRVAAAGQNNATGSVFTEFSVPDFDGALVLGGLSIAEPAARPDSVNEKDAAKTLPLAPLATREIKSGVPVVAEVPVRLNARAVSGPLVLVATLRSAGRDPLEFREEHRDLTGYATAMGAIHRVKLPQDLPAGSYQLIVEASAGRARVTRELAFRVDGPE